MNPQGPIRTIIPLTKSSNNCNIFNSVSRTFNIAYRILSWHGAERSENENLGGNNIFENAERKSNFEVGKVGRKNSVTFNHVDLNHINTDLNPLNQVDSNIADPNQSIPINLTAIHDSADIRALNKISSWYEESTDATHSEVSTRTPLANIP